MADTKTTGLTELAAAPADDDLLMVVDVSDSTMDAAGTNKKIKASNLLASGYKRSTFSDADVTIAATDKYVAQVGTMSASRTATLPAANAVVAGYEIIVADESGTVSAGNPIVITRAGSDTIEGRTTAPIGTAYGHRRLVSDGTSAWTVVGRSVVSQGLMKGSSGVVFYAIPGVHLNNGATTTFSANRCYYFPFATQHAITVTDLKAEVTVTSGTAVRFAIYNADQDWQPVGAKVATVGTIDPSSTGLKTITGLSIVLAPGKYLMGMNQDGGPGMRCGRGGPGIGGAYSFPQTGGNNMVAFVYVAETYPASDATDPGTKWLNTVTDATSGWYPFALAWT